MNDTIKAELDRTGKRTRRRLGTICHKKQP